MKNYSLGLASLLCAALAILGIKTSHFSGVIHSFTVHDRVLSDDEIAESYRAWKASLERHDPPISLP